MQLTDIDGQILYNGNAFDGGFSLCSFLRSQQTNEQLYMYKQVNRPYAGRRQQYGLVNRLRDLASGADFQTINASTHYQSIFPRFTQYSQYEERCSFGEIYTN